MAAQDKFGVEFACDCMTDKFTSLVQEYATAATRQNASTQVANSYAAQGDALLQNQRNAPCKELSKHLRVFFMPEKAELVDMEEALAAVARPPENITGKTVLQLLGIVPTGKHLLTRTKDVKNKQGFSMQFAKKTADLIFYRDGKPIPMAEVAPALLEYLSTASASAAFARMVKESPANPAE